MLELEKLKQELLVCRRCQDQLPDEPKPIFQGMKFSQIMQISQAPSKRVMETGKPFYDASGKKLLEDWYHITREQFDDPTNFYITSIGRCYPGKAKAAGDRPPIIKCADYF